MARPVTSSLTQPSNSFNMTAKLPTVVHTLLLAKVFQLPTIFDMSGR